jgi:hypothetical protein
MGRRSKLGRGDLLMVDVGYGLVASAQIVALESTAE